MTAPRLTAILLTLAISALAAVADNTISRGLRPIVREEPRAENTILPDTIELSDPAEIQLSGYDKPLQATRETLCATNNTSRRIAALVLEITYTDLAGRQIHRRRVTVSTDIPPGETRLVAFRSWDVNHTFFYRLGPKPRKSGVTPYDVTARILKIAVYP